MAGTPPPFAAFEWMIAWRYLRARRAEGGVSVMTWISLLGITLAVFALIATLAVRSGFRAEFVDTILGANAHVTVYRSGAVAENGQIDRTIRDFEAVAERLREVPGVCGCAACEGTGHGQPSQPYAGVEVFGIRQENLAELPRIADPETGRGDLGRFQEGIAIGSGVAQELGAIVGDRIKIISPNGVKTAFGTSPRVSAYEVVYIFSAGRYDIDRTRVYLPFCRSAEFFFGARWGGR